MYLYKNFFPKNIYLFIRIIRIMIDD